MSSITAKVKVHYQDPQYLNGELDQVNVHLGADYDQGRNGEWSKYTPNLSIRIAVKPELADRFPVGRAFTLTFEPTE